MHGQGSLEVISEFCISYHSREFGNYHVIEEITTHFGQEKGQTLWLAGNFYGPHCTCIKDV